MDDTDRKILNIMKGNARISFQNLGEAIGMSRVAAQKRVKKLENEGIIRGYNTYICREDEITLLIDIWSIEGKCDEILDYLDSNVVGIRQIFKVGKDNQLHVVLVSDSVENLNYIFKTIYKDCDPYLEKMTGHIVREIVKDVYGGIRHGDGCSASEYHENDGRP